MMNLLRVKVAAILCALMLCVALPASASQGFVTLGLLPVQTELERLTVRGTAPAGSIVTIRVNGETQVRMYVNDISLYRYPVELAPGWNHIETQLDGTSLTAEKFVYRSA